MLFSNRQSEWKRSWKPWNAAVRVMEGFRVDLAVKNQRVAQLQCWELPSGPSIESTWSEMVKRWNGAQVRGQMGSYPIKLFYTSNIPIILQDPSLDMSHWIFWVPTCLWPFKACLFQSISIPVLCARQRLCPISISSRSDLVEDWMILNEMFWVTNSLFELKIGFKPCGMLVEGCFTNDSKSLPQQIFPGTADKNELSKRLLLGKNAWCDPEFHWQVAICCLKHLLIMFQANMIVNMIGQWQDLTRYEEQRSKVFGIIWQRHNGLARACV